MIRKDLYFKIGAWSNEFSQVGEADGGADADLATKAVLFGEKMLKNIRLNHGAIQKTSFWFGGHFNRLKYLPLYE